MAALIDGGVLRHDDRLPAERTLARALSVSRGTVVAAYDRLRDDGNVTRVQGSGTTVRRGVPTAGAHPHSDVGEALYQGLAEAFDMRADGRKWLTLVELETVMKGVMGDVVARIFDNLAVGRPVVRLNWSLYDNNALHRPEPHEGRKWSFGGTPDPTRIFVRVERQTLTRLPASGDILFTIRIHLDPLTALADADNARELYLGLRDQLLGLDASMLGYKSMSAERDSIVALLESMAAAHS